jgi:hypothetical protein
MASAIFAWIGMGKSRTMYVGYKNMAAAQNEVNQQKMALARRQGRLPGGGLF